MAVFPRPSGPRAAVRDLFAFLRQRSREQVIGATLAVLVTIIIVIIFFVDAQVNTEIPEQVVYVEFYGPQRTDADIKRDQIRDQKAREAAKEARKREFQKLEKQLGM